MPFDSSQLIAFVGVLLAIAVWFRTRRLGPVFGILIGAFVVMAVTDTTIIENGGKMVGNAITWFFDDVLNI